MDTKNKNHEVAAMLIASMLNERKDGSAKMSNNEYYSTIELSSPSIYGWTVLEVMAKAATWQVQVVIDVNVMNGLQIRVHNN
ncbi:MAG: hypothetical protein ACK54F_03470 [Planctomycetia bacterium]|jgi:hypothetical protein